ncbi:MAG: hypothetical protein WBQ32_10105 [Ignavibacteriaceae bacterium]
MNSRSFKWEYFIALIILILILTNIQLVTFIDVNFILQAFIVIGFFLFAILGIVGLLKQKHWGYLAIYIFVLISTVGLGIAPIPFIAYLFPNVLATYLVILAGILLLSFTLYLQIKLLKQINKPKE